MIEIRDNSVILSLGKNKKYDLPHMQDAYFFLDNASSNIVLLSN